MKFLITNKPFIPCYGKIICHSNIYIGGQNHLMVLPFKWIYFAELLHGAIYFLGFHTKKYKFLWWIGFLATVKREKDEELSCKTEQQKLRNLFMSWG